MFRIAELIPGGIAERVNEASPAQFDRVLALCIDVPRWMSAMAGGRPFSDDDAVRRAVFSAAEPFTVAEIDAALRVHPRIGERPEGNDGHAARARGEQSGVDVAQSDVRARLRDGNLAYEKRFGHVFLVRAAGRGATEILAALTERLRNDPVVELRVVEHELREIAALRLTGGLADV